jgi:hypothetical protein
LGQCGGEQATVGFGEQDRDAAAEGGELVAVGVREAFDEPLAIEPAQVVGGLAGGVGLVQQGGGEPGELVVVESGARRWPKPTAADMTVMTRWSPKRSPGACRPSGVSAGRVTWAKVTTSAAGTASDAWASPRRRLAASPTARRAFQFSAVTGRPIPKSRVSEMTSSVRNARCSLKFLSSR